MGPQKDNDMWKVPIKYKTTCFSNDNGREIEYRELEAINEQEAEARAYLNCVISNNQNRNVRVEVKRA